jgi:hypothetical protein
MREIDRKAKELLNRAKERSKARLSAQQNPSDSPAKEKQSNTGMSITRPRSASMSPQQVMLLNRLVRPRLKIFGPLPPNESWKTPILEELEQLQELAVESDGKEAGSRWDDVISLVREWRTDRDALIRALEG